MIYHTIKRSDVNSDFRPWGFSGLGVTYRIQRQIPPVSSLKLPVWLYVVGDRWAGGCKEDKAGWSGFLAYLKKRGLSCPELFISDKCLGLLESLAEYYPDAQWQRCTVHWYRNVLSVVPRGRMKEVAAMLKAIHAQEDAAAAGTQWGLKRYMNMDRFKEMKRQQQEKQEVMAG